MAQADIDSIQSQIAYAKSQLEHYTIRALNDGVVISLGYDEGGLALSGTQICEISKENEKKFVFYLPEEYIDSIDYGTAITVTAKTSDNSETAKTYIAWCSTST
jgi:multidrug resistance efflux pump